MPDVHAKLSASGAKKWIACPGSVLLEASVQDKPSAYAAEGTNAHALGEAKIRLATKEYTKAKYHKAIKDLEIDDEMEEYTDAYRDFVIEQLNQAKQHTADAILLLEQRLDFSKYVPEGFGTGDCVIISDKKLHIIDLKYGKGVPIQAEGNPQMRLYALGALETYDFLYDIEEIDMCIFQPRIDNIDDAVMTAAELRAWGEEIRPAAEKAFSGTEEYCAGNHCDTNFCKARPFCRAYAERKQEMAKYDFKKPAQLTTEEISEILEQAEALAKWATLIKEYALDEAVNNGTIFPGYKVVEGRSNRAFSIDDTLIAGQLIAKGYNEDSFYPRKLIGIGALEKYLGKKDFNALLGEFVIKPTGKPTLVPESDKRPALHSADAAVKDFETIIEE